MYTSLTFNTLITKLFVYFCAMIKHIFCLLILLISISNKAGSGIPPAENEERTDLYTTLNLREKGLAPEVFELAIKGHNHLDADSKLRNSGILTIVDLSQSSKNKRMYVIDLERKELLFNTLVAHGRNTGEEYARHFSNVSGSFESSLGFYVTREEIWGPKVGLSMILDGMEKGFNDNARQREIIMHGADYATQNFIMKAGRLGRSYGCPSVPPELVKPVVETIKEGTCLFIYYPDEQYIKRSSLLN